MGIEPDRFVYSVPQDCLCILCGLVLEQPVEIIACGHRFCGSCYTKYETRVREVDRDEIECPYCGLLVKYKDSTRPDKLVWNLIQNFNIFCTNKSNGCESIFKYGFWDLHSCDYAERSEQEREKDLAEKCSLCNLKMLDNHDCLKELLQISKLATVQLANLQHENNRLIGKLTKREKEFLENITLMETQYHQENLRYNKEIRDLKSKLSTLQGQLERKNGQAEVNTIKLDLQRLDGSLGFNIIGGATENEKTSSGIYVSRVAEGGAADQPGKLQLNDRIIEVDGVDLTNATHELAVKTFRASGDPVKMVIQRNIYKKKTSEASTQTFGVMFAVTGDESRKDTLLTSPKSNEILKPFPKPKTCRWINPQELINGVNLKTDDEDDVILGTKMSQSMRNGEKNGELKSNKQDDYDSAYDTLLTQKSSRNSRSIVSSDTESSSTNQKSPSEATNETEEQPIVLRNNKKNSNSENRLSTFYVIPGEETPVTENMINGDADSADINDDDYEEYEYEEVSLSKRSEEKYGLWLCYGGEHDTDVSVYVGDIEENSVADLSGKIMVGDQIVRINGVHLENVEEAYKMLQSNHEIILVVARAVYESPDYFDEDAEETDLDMIDGDTKPSSLNHPLFESVFSKPVESLSNDVIHEVNEDLEKIDSIPENILPDDKSTSSSNDSAFVGLQRAKSLSPVTRSPVHFYATDERHRSSSVNGYYNIEKQQTFTDLPISTSLPNSPPNKSEKYSLKNFVKNKFASHEKKDKRPISNSDDSNELNKLPRCDSNSSNGSSRSKKSAGKENNSHGEVDSTDTAKSKLKEQRQLSRMKAYLDSPSLIRHRINNNMVIQPMTMKSNTHTELSHYVINNANTIPQTSHQKPSSKSNSQKSQQKIIYNNNNTSQNSKYQSNNLQNGSHKYKESHNINERLRSAMKPLNGKPTKNGKHVHIDAHAHWNDTERRVWEEFKIIQSMEAKENVTINQRVETCPKVEAEWRVRRSKDGKHIYIKKTNSTRNRILKEREEQIQQERCGMTTDDDAFTVYQGRYWDKEQRKRQLNRHNDRRKKLLQKAIAKQAYENKTEKALNEMAQRNMFIPGNTVFDNFITVEEILSQRNRCGILDGPVHVTTI